jgi:hypothetical protein
MDLAAELITELAPQVAANCRRSDAEVSGRFSLCGLLLRMRNLYKWERGLPPWREEEPARMLAWVSEREEAWGAVLDREDQEPAPLRLAGGEHDPFDVEGINALIAPAGLVYGAGRIGGLLPVFFLGRLASERRVDGLSVYAVGQELCQDIFFLAGLRQEERIYLRRQPLVYLLWDKLADPRPSMLRFVRLGLAGYGLDLAGLLKEPSWEALEPVIAGEMEAVLWHELGEAESGGAALALLHRVAREHPGSELEHFVRGVKDLLADCGPSGRLARIIEGRALGPLGFYPTWMAGFPRLLFPEIDAAMMEFVGGAGWEAIEEVRVLGWERAMGAATRLAEILEGVPAAKVLETARREVIAPLTQGRQPPARPD